MNRYPYPDFVSASPESEGVRSSAISDMLTAIREENKDIHSMLLWRHGKLIFEHYFAPYTVKTPHSMYSCSKTFTSMLIGIAQEKGLLSIHDSVLKYFPDVPVENPSDNLRAMTLEHLLMMGSGHAQDTFGYMMSCEDGDWARVFLNRPVEYKPGTHFVYNTGATYMLSAVLTRITGKTALELAEEWIFRDIGITGAAWDTCPKGVSIGGSGLHIKPRDMMRLGVLLLSRGRWNGKQIIPAAYIQAAQTKKINNYNLADPNQDPNWGAGYCYQMWRCCFDAYRADGMGGQYIVMMPKYDMVAVFTSALGSDIGYPLKLIEKYLLPNILPCGQIEQPEQAAALRLLAAQSAAPAKTAMPDAAEAFPFGKTWVLPENGQGLLNLTVLKDELHVTVAGGAVMRAKYIWNAPYVNPQPVKVLHSWMDRAPVSALARWEEGSLYLRLAYLGEPLTFHITLTPEEDGRMQVNILSTLTGRLNAVCEAGA
ncbi:MAG: serine hydrolase [Clostridia bacterium]|nr:serine hydrolase [Clostridia bacterium]